MMHAACKHCSEPFEGKSTRIYCPKCTWQVRAAAAVRATPGKCKRCGAEFKRKQGKQFCDEHAKGNRKPAEHRRGPLADIDNSDHRSIAAELGLSKTHVQNIERVALAKVKEALLAIDPEIGEP